MNLYAYVGNNPVNASDPLGYCEGGMMRQLLRESNPLDLRSTFSREAISMGDFVRGDWKSAAANSGWAQLEEMHASPTEFKVYAGTQIVAGAAAAAALAVAGFEAATGTTVLVELGTGGTRILQIRPTGRPPWFALDKGPVPSMGGRRLPHWHQPPDLTKHLPWDWFTH